MSILSIVSLLVSILGSLLYGLVFVNAGLIPAFIIVTIASIILPPIAKKQRGKKGKKGKVAEIIAIILGGLNFYCIVFALTNLSTLMGFLGWVVCGLAYKFVEIDKTD